MMKTTTKSILATLWLAVFLLTGWKAESAFSMQLQNAPFASNLDNEMFWSVHTWSEHIAELQQVISVRAENAPVREVLEQIAGKAKLGIAYNPDLASLNRRIDFDQQNVTVGNALMLALEGTEFDASISRTREIVLRKRPEAANPAEEIAEEVFQQTVTGRVVSAASGESMPGVNILIAGTEQGTVTDLDGNFQLRVPSLDVTLVFTYIGHVRQEVPLNGRTRIDVVLAEQIIEGQELVVTAFGIERESKSLTYSAQSVDVAAISEARELNVMASLQGKVAGLTISSASNGVGSPTRVVLRGNRSISGSSQPLYVLDGVPIRGNPQDINPEDIVSIDVLKGPNAAALYGSAAQNGAIVLTTRSADKDQVKISLSNTFQVEDAIITIPFQNEYGQGSGGIYSPSSEYSWGPKMTGQDVQFWSPNPNHPLYGQTYKLTPQPNNVKDLFQRGYNNATNLTASMGGERTQTLFSYTLTGAEGMVPNNALSRHNVSVRVGSQISDRLSLDTRLTYMQQKIDNRVSTGEGFTNPMRNAYRIPRSIHSAHLQDFEYIDDAGINRQHYFNPGSNGGNNPYWVLNRIQSVDNRERVLALASLRYEFSDALSLMVRASFDGSTNQSDTKTWVDSYVTADRGLYSVSHSFSRERNGDFLLTYSDYINEDFDFNINFGGSIQQGRNGGLSSNTNRDVGLTVPNLFAISNTQNVIASHNVGSPSDVHSLYSFGQISYRSSLFLDVTARNDWSSTLPENNRSYFYPSVGLSAVLSDLIPSFPEFFSFFRVRASWAQVGSSASPYSLTRTATVRSGGKSGFLTLSNTLPNADLRPEMTTSTEVGMDLRFFQGRIGLDVTAYQMNTGNQLFTVALPIGSGAGEYYTNGGDVENKGIEFLLTTRPVENTRFSWDLNFNFSLNRNTVVSISEERPRVVISSNFIRDFVIEEGEPFGNIYSRDFVRDDQGRVVVDPTGLPLLTQGRTELVANYNPDWTGGISSSFAWKNFSASILIDHRQGGTFISQSDAIIMADGVTKNTLHGREGGLVFGQNFFENETAVLEDGTPNNLEIDAESFWRHVGGRNAPVGGVFVESATNTRLREMTLGYSVPASALAGLPISGAKISLVGRNLFFIYKASENNDPDILTGTGESSEGLNAFALPTARTFGVNLKIDF